MNDIVHVDWGALEPCDPKFVRPEILLDPGVLPALHGVNPRSILGPQWWARERVTAFIENNYCCWACGIHQDHAAYFKRLEGHERYEIDHETHRATYVQTAGLCYCCHAFIHMGHTRLQYLGGDIPWAQYEAVRVHGYRILQGADLFRDFVSAQWPEASHPGSDWVLLIDGKEYTKDDTLDEPSG